MFEKLFGNRNRGESAEEAVIPEQDGPEVANVQNEEQPVETAPEELEQDNKQELKEEKKARLSNERARSIGAVVLTKVGFESRHKDIVDSSFEKAREAHEKLTGGGNQRRNYAYISRMESLVEEHGNELEKRLWSLSASKLIIDPKNIDDNYWRSQEQIIRDETGQTHTLTESEKEQRTEEIQKNQRDSLETWSNYLGREDLPFPMWFKIYAWDGMSKMSVFDREKKIYAKRDEHTVAPYPQLNPAALAKVYGAIDTAYEQERGQDYTPNSEEVEALVKRGDFNVLYSHFLLQTKNVLDTPERAEDIRGSWIEYKLGDEKALAAAAEGSPWCIVNPKVGRNYLLNGTSGQGESNKNSALAKENQARFFLFHLENPKTGKLSPSACASIRLNTRGRVAEISGLKTGQALDDSLIPAVESKVKSLPGGENYLDAFADKKQLIALDHKMKRNEELTKEELEFIYEIHRPIRNLDTYNPFDLRIQELREKYNPEYALGKGLSADSLVEKSYPEELEKHLQVLFENNANMDRLMKKLRPAGIVKNYAYLTEHGIKVNLDETLQRLKSEEVEKYQDTLFENGVDIDKIVSRMEPNHIFASYDKLIERGASIDINHLVEDLSPEDVGRCQDTLFEKGADIDKIASRMEPHAVLLSHKKLTERGASVDIDHLVENLSPDDCWKFDDKLLDLGANADKLLSRIEVERVTSSTIHALLAHGANANAIAAKAPPSEIAKCLDELIEHGAKINMRELAKQLKPREIAYNLDALKQHGARIRMRKLVSRLEPADTIRTIDSLAKYHARVKIDEVISKIAWRDQDVIEDNLEKLLKNGANPDKIVSKLSHGSGYYDIVKHLDLLYQYKAHIDIENLTNKADIFLINHYADAFLRHGADANKIASRMNSYGKVENLDTLIEHGADINIDAVTEDLDARTIVEHIDVLTRHHAKIDDIDTLVSKLSSWQVFELLEPILSHGADIEKVLAKMPKLDTEDIEKCKNVFAKYNVDQTAVEAALKRSS